MTWFGQYFGPWFGSWFGESSGNATASVEKGTITEIGYDATATVETITPELIVYSGGRTRRIRIDEYANAELGIERIKAFDATAKTNARAGVESAKYRSIAKPATARASSRAWAQTARIRTHGGKCDAKTVDFDLQLVAALAMAED